MWWPSGRVVMWYWCDITTRGAWISNPGIWISGGFAGCPAPVDITWVYAIRSTTPCWHFMPFSTRSHNQLTEQGVELVHKLSEQVEGWLAEKMWHQLWTCELWSAYSRTGECQTVLWKINNDYSIIVRPQYTSKYDTWRQHSHHIRWPLRRAQYCSASKSHW